MLALGITLSGCAARRITLPTDQGAPFPDFDKVHEKISAACRGVRTLTAELGLRGRSGDQRIRGRVVAGFERPASMRLEGVAPFGPPAFILVARAGSATLLLPRDSRVVRNAPPEDILGALTGITLGPADLQAALTGCVVPDPRAMGGRLHAKGWASIDLVGGATLYLQQSNSEWTVLVAQRQGWRIEYSDWQTANSRSLRLLSEAGSVNVEVTATIAQLETNIDVDAAAFKVDVPSDAQAMTVGELRELGPLRGQ